MSITETTDKEAHLSDSKAQREAEPYIRQRLEEEWGLPQGSVRDGNISELTALGVQVDACYWPEEGMPILAEVYVRNSPLLAGNKRKVLTDAFKLAWLGQALSRPCEKYIVFTCEEACRSFQGKGWAARAMEDFGIQCLVIPLSEELEQKVAIAKIKQVEGMKG